MRATKKKQAKKTQFFLFPEINLVFFGMLFLSTKIKCFFSENWQQFNARAGQKKTTCFFGCAWFTSNARAHLKQRKKHSGLI